jgi:hypothetical protein
MRKKERVMQSESEKQVLQNINIVIFTAQQYCSRHLRHIWSNLSSFDEIT